MGLDDSAGGHGRRWRTSAFAAATVVVAGVLATVAARSESHGKSIPIGYLILFSGLVAFAECLRLRYFHHDQVEWLTLVEGMFAPLIFCGSGLDVVVASASGLAVASVLRRAGVLESIYRVSRWTAAVSVGVLAFRGSGVTRTDSSESVLALVGAMLAVAVVDQIVLAAGLWWSNGRPVESEDQAVMRVIMIGRAGTFAVGTILGLFMTAAYMWVPWTTVFVATPLVFLWSAGRSEASIRADRRLLDGLQRATHHLATSLEPATALPLSLAQTRAAFEVKEVQLVLVAERGFPTIYRCSAGEAMQGPRSEPHGLAELLADSLTTPARLGATGGDVAEALSRMGFQRGLAAPLRSGGVTFGVLLLLDREGVEGFEAGELSIAGALARELVGFLERVQLVAAIEEERRKVNDIVQHSGDGIVSLDTTGKVLSWNAAIEAITGYGAAEMVNRRQLSLLRPRDNQGRDVDLIDWFEQFAATGAPADLQIVAVDGSVVWMSCSSSIVPGRDGHPGSVIIVARNITKARELELLKDDFIAVVSHELRTPLVPIKGWAQTLLARGDRLSSDQVRTAVQSILTQAQRLEALVLNILESSRVEAGQAEALDLVDAAAVVAGAVEDVLAARPDRVIRFGASGGSCMVRGSIVWIDRAVANLVANAVKYSPDDTAVDVTVDVVEGAVVVSVTDRGPGIAAGSLERIFERFERLDNPRKQTGTGLGLYITRRLARAMGGDVTVTSVPGAGSTFILSLPAVTAADTAARMVPSPRSSAPRPEAGVPARPVPDQEFGSAAG